MEISAITQLGLNWLLCKFYILQDWERFLKHSGNAVPEPQRQQVLKQLRHLIEIRDEQIFSLRGTEFADSLSEFPALQRHYLENWERDSSHWAAFGRVELAELACDTNNFLERFFHALKLNFCNSKRGSRLSGAHPQGGSQLSARSTEEAGVPAQEQT